MKRVWLWFAGLLLAAPLVGQAGPVVIDMEGFAPFGNITDEVATTKNYGDYRLNIPSGHFVDSSVAVLATHDSDWLWVDSDTFSVTSAAGPFALLSFRGTDSFGSGSEAAVPGLIFRVVGAFAAGGFISQAFVSDRARTFETFTLGVGWTGLTSVTFSTHRTSDGPAARRGGYDDIIVSDTALAVVPEPATLALFGVGGIGLIGAWSRRRHVVNV